MDHHTEAYRLAQRAIADLKAAVLVLLKGQDTSGGLSNAEIGRRLGIHRGHVRHDGHVSRTVLAKMAADDVVVQDPNTKRWRVS